MRLSFLGVTVSSRHAANECRIAFWADSPSEVDRLAEIIVRRELEMSKALGITKGLATTRSFSRIQRQSVGNLPSNRRSPMNAIGSGRAGHKSEEIILRSQVLPIVEHSKIAQPRIPCSKNNPRLMSPILSIPTSLSLSTTGIRRKFLRPM